MKAKRKNSYTMSNFKRKHWLKSFICFSLTLIMFNVNTLGSMNMVVQAATTPLSYYQNLEKEYMNKLVDSLTNTYTDYIKNYQDSLEKQMGLDATIKATIAPSMTDDTYLEGVRSIEAAVLTMMKGKESKTDVVISANDKELVSMETYTSLDDLFYLVLPELSEAYLKVDTQDLDEYTTSTSIVNYMSNPISEELLNKLMKKYGVIIIENIKNVTAQDDVYVEINDVISKHTKLTVSLDEMNMLDITEAILNEAKNDSELKTLFIDLGICSGVEYDTAINEALVNISKDQQLLNDLVTGGQKIIKMYIWVNNKGDIAGRSISLNLFGDILTFGYRTTQFSNKIGIESWIILNHEDVLRGKGKVTANLSGISGNFDISVPDSYYDETSVIHISFENIKYEKKDISGLINGKISISSNDWSDVLMNIELVGEHGKQSIVLDILGNNKSIINISSIVKLVPYTEYRAISSTDKVYDFETELNDYIENADVKGFLEGIKEKSDIYFIDIYIDSILEAYEIN